MVRLQRAVDDFNIAPRFRHLPTARSSLAFRVQQRQSIATGKHAEASSAYRWETLIGPAATRGLNNDSEHLSRSLTVRQAGHFPVVLGCEPD